MELGPEDVPLLEKCYVQASMPDVSLLEVSSFQRIVLYRSWDLKMWLEVSSFQRIVLYRSWDLKMWLERCHAQASQGHYMLYSHQATEHCLPALLIIILIQYTVY